MIQANALVVVSIGYESLDLNTGYNQGSIKDNGFTIAPYAGYALTDNLIFNFLLGYTYMENDVVRTQQSEPINGSFLNQGVTKTFSTSLPEERINGSLDSNRLLFSANVNYAKLINNWSFSAFVGYMYVNEITDNYQEKGGHDLNVSSQDIYLSETRIGGRASYLTNKFEPYVSVAYLYDNDWNYESSDRDELEGTVGLNWSPNDSWIVSLEPSNSFLRENTENTWLMFNLHFNLSVTFFSFFYLNYEGRMNFQIHAAFLVGMSLSGACIINSCLLINLS